MRKVLAKNHEQAFELFKESGGSLSNTEIATAVGVSETTVRKWKSRYKWLEKTGVESCHTTVTKKSVTKKEPDAREEHRRRIVSALTEAGTYSPALDLLIEIYLDAYAEYQIERSEKLRRELAKYLGQLGLDAKNKAIIKPTVKNDEEKTEEPTTVSNKLVQFRQRKMRT